MEHEATTLVEKVEGVQKASRLRALIAWVFESIKDLRQRQKMMDEFYK